MSRRLLIVALLLALSVTAVHAAAGGTTGAAFLQLGTGPRTAALGQANVAWADDVYGMYFNPAGIATVGRQEVGFAYNALVLDLDYNYIGYLLPLRSGGTLGFGLQYVDLGTVERREIAAGGGPTAALGTATGHDLAFSTTYARTMTDFLDLGATLKIVNESLDDHSAAAIAVDIGAKWRPPVPGLTVGLSISNFGTSLKFVRSREDLPLTLRFGAGYRPISGRWGVVGDVYYVRNHDLEGGIGGEWWVWPEHIVLRAGANTTTDEGSGLSVGAGFKWNDVAIDYAFVPYGDLGDQNTIAVAYQFGPTVRGPAPAPAARPRSARPAPQPEYTPAPEPSYTPPVQPVPAGRVPITRVAVGLVSEFGSGTVSSLGRQITLALIWRLRERGLEIDPQADAVFNGSYALLEDGSLTVYGRVRDRATGRALRGVKVLGRTDAVDQVVDNLARQFE